jgi:hypothetical protein
MSTPEIEIITKLTKELGEGITSEVQVVYLLVGLRKRMERDNISESVRLTYERLACGHRTLQAVGNEAAIAQCLVRRAHICSRPIVPGPSRATNPVEILRGLSF